MTATSRERFIATHPKSREQWERSIKVSRGIHHDSRHTNPFPIYVTHAKGSRKWDVDGNEYVDYTMGHGSLMFGHAHPTLIEVVSQQVVKGTHYGAETPSAVEWSETICQLIPAAERVEFVMTGTEADMLIAQLARDYTGRNKILKFSQHFFGWSEELHAGVLAPYDRPMPGRLPPVCKDALSDGTVIIPINDATALEKALANRDVAALFVEGAGAHCGAVGIPPELMKTARELTRQYGTLLVIDEVVTGFRWAPGGYQATIGVTPDLASLGKMVTGGLPGAGVCGRADIMELLQYKDDQPDWNRNRKVVHPGTWNGNPLSTVAGVTMLKMIASGEPQRKAEESAHRLAMGMNEKLEERGVQGCAHNASSALHLYIGKCQGCDRSNCLDSTKAAQPSIIAALNMHLLLNGVHMLRGALGWVSAVHTDEDIAATIEAFGRAIDGMVKDGIISQKASR